MQKKIIAEVVISPGRDERTRVSDVCPCPRFSDMSVSEPVSEVMTLSVSEVQKNLALIVRNDTLKRKINIQSAKNTSYQTIPTWQFTVNLDDKWRMLTLLITKLSKRKAFFHLRWLQLKAQKTTESAIIILYRNNMIFWFIECNTYLPITEFIEQ